MNIGKGIRTARAARGFKLNELAARSGLSTSYLSLVEAGKRDPSMETISKVAEAIGIPTPLMIFLASEAMDLEGIDAETSKLIGDATLKLLSSMKGNDDETE